MNTRYKYALAMGAGFALGAAAIHSLHAQAKPLAYYIGEITVKDQGGFIKQFAAPGAKLVQEAGGKFIVRGFKPIALQGESAPRVTVIQFNNMDKAQAWWNSQTNKDQQAIGEKYATFRPFSSKAFRHNRRGYSTFVPRRPNESHLTRCLRTR